MAVGIILITVAFLVYMERASKDKYYGQKYGGYYIVFIFLVIFITTSISL